MWNIFLCINVPNTSFSSNRKLQRIVYANFDTPCSFHTSSPGKLKKFVEDLHSGKLHQDFHNPSPDSQVQGHNHGQPQQIQPEATQVYFKK